MTILRKAANSAATTAVLLATPVWVAACAPTQRVDLGGFQNGADLVPVVSRPDAIAGAVDNLTQGEALIVATDDAQQVQIQSPNTVSINVFKQIRAEPAAPAEQHALEFSKAVRNDRGEWVTARDIQLEADTPIRQSAEFRIMAFNRGQAPFQGNVLIYDRLVAGARFDKVTKARVFEDVATRNAALTSIPVFGFFALALDDFPTVDGEHEIKNYSREGLLEVDFGNVMLAPAQGIELVFTADLDLSSFK